MKVAWENEDKGNDKISDYLLSFFSAEMYLCILTLVNRKISQDSV